MFRDTFYLGRVPYRKYIILKDFPMPIILILVGCQIYRSHALTEAIIRELEAKNRFIKSIYHMESDDKALIDLLQHLIEKSCDICIAASTDSFPLISRILATLNEDTLIATGETLHPGGVSMVKENSFLLRLNDIDCNALLVKSNEAIPEILLETGEAYSVWQLFGNEKHLQTLRQHALDNQYHLNYFQQVEEWYEIHIQSSYRPDTLLAPSPDLLIFPSDNIFDTCIEIFGGRKETLSFAESCTGGLIASSFTARSGSSNILKGSIVSYANEIKQQWLHVDADILENPGAVSRECVEMMAEGAMKLAQSDIALATSGIAGPTGGTPLKPVGTVYIAVADQTETRSKHLLLKGDRNYIQYQAMMHVIKLMIEMKRKIFQEFFKIS